MVRKIFVGGLIIASSLILFSGCSKPQTASSEIKVVTSFYPLYELAKNIGGEKIVVKNLVPAGAEPHDYEPTPQDIVLMNESGLLIVNGGGFEPWADKMLGDLQNGGVKVLAMSSSLQNLIAGDPHFWLDPALYLQAGQLVEQKLAEIDPANSEYFQKNFLAYSAKLKDLDNKFSAGLANCSSHTILTSHQAFGYLTNKYNLELISVVGISPDSEPSAQKIAELTDLAKAKGLKYIFTEPLSSPKIAQTLATEAKIQTMVLNPLEGLTDEQVATGENYISVMESNLANIRTALGCS